MMKILAIGNSFSEDASAYIHQMAEKYDVVETCLDPWNATQLMSHLIEDGFRVIETRMGYKTLSEPTKDLEGKILNKKKDLKMIKTSIAFQPFPSWV